MENNNMTCSNCLENDSGLCDLKGVLVEDDDSCDKWTGSKENWRDKMLNTFLAGH